MKVRDKIEDIRAIVEGGPSSIFTRADVLALLASLSECEEPTGTIPEMVLDRLKDSLDRVRDSVSHVSPYNCDVDLSLDGMEIVIESVSLHDADELCDNIEAALKIVKEALTATRAD